MLLTLLKSSGAAPGAITGTLAASESGADSFAAAGTVGSAAITGTLSATESGTDAFAAAGKVIVKGTLATSESGADSFAATGTAGSAAITGTLAATESGADVFTSSSSSKIVITGSNTGKLLPGWEPAPWVAQPVDTVARARRMRRRAEALIVSGSI